jgi:DNA modification methylase
MALKNNRRFAGIEISSEYLDIAKRRLEGTNAPQANVDFLPLPAPEFPELQTVN